MFADGGFLPDFGDVFQVFRSGSARTGDFTYPVGGYDLDGYRVADPAVRRSRDCSAEPRDRPVGPLPVIDPIDDVTVNEGADGRASPRPSAARTRPAR